MSLRSQIFVSRPTDSALKSVKLFRVTLGIACVSSLWLMGISLFSSVLVTGIIGILISFGGVACRYVGLGEVGIGVGMMVGSGFLVLSSQFLLISGIPALLVHLTTSLVMLFFAIVHFRGLQIQESSRSSLMNKNVLFCLAISLTVLAVRHPWLWFFAVPFLIYERYVSNRQTLNRVSALLFMLCGIGLFLSKQFQPTNWWYYYQGNDAQFFEAAGFTLSQWGVFTHPGTPEFSFANYHWLTYALFGQLTQLAILDTWDALLKVGPLLIPFGIAGVLTKRVPEMQNGLFVLVLLGTLGLTSRSTDSYAFSLPVGFTAIYIAQRFTAEKTKYQTRDLLFLLYIFTVLIFSKVSTALVVLVFLGLKQLVDFRTVRFRQWIPLLAFVFTGLMWYLFLFRGHPATPKGFEIDLQNAGERLISRFSDQQYALQLLVYVVLIVLFWRLGLSGVGKRGLTLATATTILSSILIDTFIVGPQMQYWVLVGLCIAVYVAFSNIPLELEGASVIDSPAFWIVVASLFGLFTARIWNRILHFMHQTLGAMISDSWWNIVQSNGLILIAITASIALTVLSQRTSRNLLLGIVPLLTLVFGFVAETGRQNYLSLNVHRFGSYVLENPSGGNSAPFAGGDLQQVAEYIRESTPSNTFLASNNFCCVGDSWWPFSRTTDPQDYSNISSQLGPEWTGGANYLLPAYTRRRFLMQGLAFQISRMQLTSQQVVRMTLSLEFANSPTMQTLQDLKARGVSGFVVNLSLTEHRDWSEFAIERFRSGNFVYLEFR